MAKETILLVDDDEVLLGTFRAFLSSQGYEVRTAADGADALWFVHAGLTPNLVITDVRMPNIDGLELIRRLRAHHRTADLPIIVLSDAKRTEDVLAGFKRGADDYIPKPVALPVLAAKIETLLRRSRRAGTPEASTDMGALVVFVHAKGGVGATTAAVNVGGELLLGGSYPVALLDLNLDFSNVPTVLNIHPIQTVADLAGFHIEDESEFQSLVQRHSSNMWVVLGTGRPEQADLVTPSAVDPILRYLRHRAQHVLVDLPAGFSEVNLAAIESADVVCLVTSAQVASVKATVDCLGTLGTLKVARERIVVVLNRITPWGATDNQVAMALGCTPHVVIPCSDRVYEAADAGWLVTRNFSKDAAAVKLGELGSILANMTASLPVRQPADRRR